MEYATAQQSNAKGYADVTASHFEGLPQLAERGEMVCDRIQRFIDRFHGCAVAPGANGVAPVPVGHIGQLHRISSAIERLEKLASELDVIG